MSGWIKIPQVGLALTHRQKRVAAMLEQGATPSQIARQLHTRIEFVEDDIYHINAAKYRKERIEMAGERWTDEEVATAIAMHAEGKSTKEIAEKLGRSEGTTAVKLCALRKSGQLDSPAADNTQESADTQDNAEDKPTAAVPDTVAELVENAAEDTEHQIALIKRRLQELNDRRDELREWLRSVRRS